MSWNHRIMKYDTGEYGIHEVYYTNDGAVEGWTMNAVGIHGMDLKDLRKGYDLIQSAFSDPVLDYETGKEVEP